MNRARAAAQGVEGRAGAGLQRTEEGTRLCSGVPALASESLSGRTSAGCADVAEGDRGKRLCASGAVTWRTGQPCDTLSRFRTLLRFGAAPPQCKKSGSDRCHPSLRRRGCSQAVRSGLPPVRPFPAQAGVFPGRSFRVAAGSSLPRAGGGVPRPFVPGCNRIVPSP